MYLEKILSLRRTVAFRLTVWYASFFTGGILIAVTAFHFLLLRGIHNVHLSPYSLHELLEAYRSFFGYSLAGVALVSLFVGWFLAKRALSGVVQLTKTANTVAGGALKERVPVKGQQDEIDRLAMTFNTMLDRINALIQGMKETNDSIAHDLRSPITRMRGFAEAELTHHSSSDAHALAGDVVEQCDRLLGMINTVLDISEAEAGVVKLVIEEVDVAHIVQDAIGLFLPMAEDKNITTKIQAPSGVKCYSDRRKLQRILGNLLDNAIKFTPLGGTIEISVTGDEKETTIGVKDTGIGISEKDITQIFEKFFRADKSRSEAGSGLGLSLARAFVSSLGGSITAISVPGEGSTFTVIVPRA
jgi:signal transduction histidine kinase